jgi:hypothetical protein
VWWARGGRDLEEHDGEGDEEGEDRGEGELVAHVLEPVLQYTYYKYIYKVYYNIIMLRCEELSERMLRTRRRAHTLRLLYNTQNAI